MLGKVAVFLMCPEHLREPLASAEAMCRDAAGGVELLMQNASVGANVSLFSWDHIPGVLVSARNTAELDAALDALIARGDEVPEFQSQRWEIKWSLRFG